MKFLDICLVWLGSRWPAKKFVRRFVSGDTMEDAFRVAEKLNREGFEALINFLGEEVKNQQQARDNARMYKEILRQIHLRRLKARISIKPSQLGLRISQDFYRHNFLEVGRDAFLMRIPLEIDIETEDTAAVIIQETIYLKKYYSSKYFGEIDLRQAMAMNFSKNISFEILSDLTAAGVKVRLCKGAYPSEYDEKKISRKFFAAADYLLRCDANPDFATHDLQLHQEIFKLRNEYPAVCGFQFLLGLRERTWKKLAKEGERVAIYVPFGSHWLPYAKRRWTYIIKKIPSMICDEIAKK